MAAMSDSPTTATRPPLSQPRHWPMYAALGVAFLIARLPWPVQRLLGRLLGTLAWHLAGTRRRAAEVNLALCFPQMPAAERRQLARDSFSDLGIGIFEFARAWWGSTDAVIPGTRIEGLDILHRLQAEGRGVLLVSGHFMTLEMCGRLLCQQVPLAGMYRKHRNPVMEWAVKRGRLGYATAMFANEDVRATVRHLKKGGMLWYAPDQDMRGKESVFVPFFGQPASTITATHQFARMTGCAVVPFFHRREGASYVLTIGQPLDPFPTEDVATDTAAVNAAIEQMVLQAPSQYLWIHRRFKRQPGGTSTYYARPQPPR